LVAAHTKASGANHPTTADALDQLGQNLLQQRKFGEAEPVLRDCLKTRVQLHPNTWLTFSTQAALRASLLGQRRYAHAEPLLLAGYQGMKAREKTVPPRERSRLLETAQHLAELYDAWGRKDQADVWRQRVQAIAGSGPPQTRQ
jgi:hypothetical protein